MIWTESLALMQAAPELAGAAGRIAWAEVVTAGAAAVLALVALGAAVVAYRTFTAVTHLLTTLERTLERMAPKVEPFIEHAGRIAEDARHVGHRVRTDVERMHETADELNRKLRAAIDRAEERVRQFGAVLEVVQDEMEELLLDAAATARGVHATAQGLQRSETEARDRPRPVLEK